MSSVLDSKKAKPKIGRPTTGIGPTIGVRLYPDLESMLAVWIAAQPKPRPSRPAAIRALLREVLTAQDQRRAPWEGA